jgi:DNA repair protein RadA/Sms
MGVTARRAAVTAVFACTECGDDTPKWAGRCPACGAWNSLVETAAVTGRRTSAPRATAVPQTLAQISGAPARRAATGIDELDRVLGGGIVAGGLVLLGGDPGIGKSTLALQAAQAVGTPERPSLYCAGEESPAQLALRARRLGCSGDRLTVLGETDLETCASTIETLRPPLAVVDSVQTIDAAGSGGQPGSPGQVREAVSRLMACAKSSGVPILLIGHVTKEGAIAGPRTLEHMVDVVLFLEGERHGENRLLRGIKNRFGTTGELGLFRMVEAGMEGVGAPGRAFLDETSLGIAGNVLTVTCEGTRPIAVEVQALTAVATTSFPRRTASGFDLGRLLMLVAVIERRAGFKISFEKEDVFFNCVGGVRIAEPAADLAALLAIVSARRGGRLEAGTIALGEVGLGGELRRVGRFEARLAEALALGITHAIVPAAHRGAPPPGMRLTRAATVADALLLLGR